MHICDLISPCFILYFRCHAITDLSAVKSTKSNESSLKCTFFHLLFTVYFLLAFSATVPSGGLLFNIQSLMRSVQAIDSHLQSLENASASAFVAHAKASQSFVPQLDISGASCAQTLASAVSTPLLGRPFFPLLHQQTLCLPC